MPVPCEVRERFLMGAGIDERTPQPRESLASGTHGI